MNDQAADAYSNRSGRVIAWVLWLTFAALSFYALFFDDSPEQQHAVPSTPLETAGSFSCIIYTPLRDSPARVVVLLPPVATEAKILDLTTDGELTTVRL